MSLMGWAWTQVHKLQRSSTKMQGKHFWLLWWKSDFAFQQDSCGLEFPKHKSVFICQTRKNYKSSFIKAVFKVQLTVGIDSFWIQSSLENQPLESPQFSTFVPHTFNIFSWTFSNVHQSLNFFFFFTVNTHISIISFYYWHFIILLITSLSLYSSINLFFMYFRVTCKRQYTYL